MEVSALLVQIHFAKQVLSGARRVTRSAVVIHVVRSTTGRFVKDICPNLPDRGNKLVQRFGYRRKHPSRV